MGFFHFHLASTETRQSNRTEQYTTKYIFPFSNLQGPSGGRHANTYTHGGIAPCWVLASLSSECALFLHLRHRRDLTALVPTRHRIWLVTSSPYSDLYLVPTINSWKFNIFLHTTIMAHKPARYKYPLSHITKNRESQITVIISSSTIYPKQISLKMQSFKAYSLWSNPLYILS